jgi:hypothetical protein
MIYDLEAAGQTDLLGQTEPLLCISLWMPWAQWVILGWKAIETRTHDRFRSLPGQRIGIHASKKWDRRAIHIARPYLTADQFNETLELFRVHHHVAGKILGTVFVAEHRRLRPEDARAALIECETPRLGLILQKRNPFVLPFPAVGRQGIFRVTLPATHTA